MMIVWVLGCFSLSVIGPLGVRLGLRGALWGLFPLAGFGWFLARAQGALVSPEMEGVSWVPALSVEFAFRLDGLSQLFALLVLGIGTLITVYADGYFGKSAAKPRFYAFLFAFMGSMLGLVLADDLITLFVFWEATSITSFALIGFDHDRPDARRSARQALIVTGMGGLALLGAAVVLYDVTGTFRISEIVAQGDVIRADPRYGLILVLVLLGAFTKSAQVPFHFWLPAAMAGPTPVSAYLHSATMVKAGVYLLARLFPALSGTPEWTWTLVLLGGITCAGTSWVSLRQTDLKSMLAYSTTMALGLFVVGFGVGTEDILRGALAYLVVHALYKGALFMAAGAIDHEANTRDLRDLAGLLKRMPVTAAAVALCCASMAGLPPFFGFSAKEALYESGLHGHEAGFVGLGFMFLANLALVAVAFVLLFQPFLRSQPERAPEPPHAHEGPWTLWIGPLVLGLAGLALGLSSAWGESVLFTPALQAMLPHHDLPKPKALALWHGLTPALGLGITTIVAGLFLGRFAVGLRESLGLRALGSLFAHLPDRGFERLLAATVQTSAGMVRYLFPRRLRVSLGVLLLGLLAAPWSVGGNWLVQHEPADLGPPVLAEDVLLCVFLVGSSFAAAVTRRPVRAMIALGVSGYSVALLYLFFGAPDLGMTQLSIETLTVLLVALILRHLPRRLDEMERTPGRWRDATLAGALGTSLGALMWVVATSRPVRDLNTWYLEHSVPEAHGHNVVNVILVDFRAFDTWGEITVFALAGIGVFALLREPGRKETD